MKEKRDYLSDSWKFYLRSGMINKLICVNTKKIERRKYMKKQLPYFEIEGEFGGNQDWFTNVVMHVGGCAAATACDSCIYFALHKGQEELYPYDIHALTKEDYKAFSMKMKPYLKPRRGGVDELSIYIEGFQKYLSDIGMGIDMEAFSGTHSFAEAKKAVMYQIDSGYPIPYLLLRHQDKEQFKDFIWHWFLLVGYEEKEDSDDILVTTATYGEGFVFSLQEMWDTGCEKKGGMILYK